MVSKISDLKVGDQVVTKKGKIDTFVKIHRCCGAARLTNHWHVGSYQIDWQKTNELNNNKMKEILIEAPTGMEIYQENNTIKFRNIENKLPMSVEEIPNRRYMVTPTSKSYVSTKERAEAFLALMQLVELRDAWNGDSERHDYLLTLDYGKLKSSELLSIKTSELRNKFEEQFKELIETAKELL